jgi:glycosyltransferase involved in cell wall biosynthesis
MLKPLLTILLPLSRVDDFLAISIQSIKNQTFTDYVCYLLARPLSTDELCRIQVLITDDPRFSVHELSLGGIAFALNYGINIATTKYIARMDADDISHPNRFERQINFMEFNPSYVLVGCRVGLIDNKGNPQKHRFKFFETNKQIRAALKYRMPLCHPALLFRSQILFENKGYLYGNTAEDHELFLRIARNNSSLMYNLPIELFYYRRHDRQLTNIKYARAAYNNISGFIFTEFLLNYNPIYLIGIILNHPLLRKLRLVVRRINGSKE